MGDPIEKKCPLCGAPRPRGAKRCICNYTFEYERESRPFRRISSTSIGSGSGAGGVHGPVVLVFALIAGVAALVYMRTLKLDPEQGAVGFLLVPAGLFAIAGGFFDWGFFMRNRRARKFVWIFGRGGARFVYGILGGGLAGAGAALLLA